MFSLDGHMVKHVADPREIEDFSPLNVDLLVCDYQFGEVTAAFVAQLPGFDGITNRILLSGHVRGELPDDVVERFSTVIHKSDFGVLRSCVESFNSQQRVI